MAILKYKNKQKKTLKDAAVLNSTRKALIKQIGKIGLPLEIGTGALTKYNRAKRKLPKTHWIDAVCVGASTPKTIELEGIYPISIIATGHGSRQMCRVDKYGFRATR